MLYMWKRLTFLLLSDKNRSMEARRPVNKNRVFTVNHEFDGDQTFAFHNLLQLPLRGTNNQEFKEMKIKKQAIKICLIKHLSPLINIPPIFTVHQQTKKTLQMKDQTLLSFQLIELKRVQKWIKKRQQCLHQLIHQIRSSIICLLSFPRAPKQCRWFQHMDAKSCESSEPEISPDKCYSWWAWPLLAHNISRPKILILNGSLQTTGSTSYGNGCNLMKLLNHCALIINALGRCYTTLPSLLQESNKWNKNIHPRDVPVGLIIRVHVNGCSRDFNNISHQRLYCKKQPTTP